MVYVHHPDKDYAATERVGARLVRFDDGRAEVTVPSVVRHYRRLGYELTEERTPRPRTAGDVDPDETPVVVLDGAETADDAGGGAED